MTVQTPAPKENLLINIVCNIAVPTVILTKFSGATQLGPVVGLIIALMFPIGYGIYDYVRRRKANFISIIGFISVLLSGGLGLLKMGGAWFAVKEAAMPLVIAGAVLISARTKRPLVRDMIYNAQIMDIERVDAALAARNNIPAFSRLLKRASLWLSAAFLLSAALNFGLARYLLKSAPGTTEFNGELGRMHALSWPVIVLPSMAAMMLIFWMLVRELKNLTGLTLDEIFRTEGK